MCYSQKGRKHKSTFIIFQIFFTLSVKLKPEYLWKSWTGRWFSQSKTCQERRPSIEREEVEVRREPLWADVWCSSVDWQCVREYCCWSGEVGVPPHHLVVPNHPPWSEKYNMSVTEVFGYQVVHSFRKNNLFGELGLRLWQQNQCLLYH